MVNEFLTIAKEDILGTEKNLNGNMTGKVAYGDFISTDASDGNMSPPDLFDKTDKTFLTAGKIKKIDKLYYQPEISALTGLKGFMFLVQSGGEIQGNELSSLDGDGDKTYINVTSKKNKSFTLYAKGESLYSNAALYALGAQLNELDLALEDGEVSIDTTFFASRQKLDETNLERGKTSYDGESISYSNLKKIEIADFNRTNNRINVPVADTAWTNIGCDIQSGDFTLNFDLQEDTGFGFCNEGWSNGFKCGTVECTSSVEVTQESDIWMKLTNGGTMEFSKLARKAIRYHLEDEEYILHIILPYGVFGLEGANISTDNPTETISIDNETANVTYDGKDFNKCECLMVLTKKDTTA